MSLSQSFNEISIQPTNLMYLGYGEAVSHIEIFSANCPFC
jgi:hypothetical protein